MSESGKKHRTWLTTQAVENVLVNSKVVQEQLALPGEARKHWSILSQNSTAQLQLVLGVALVHEGQHVTACLQVWNAQEASLIEAFQYNSLFFLKVEAVVGVDLQAVALLEDIILREWNRTGCSGRDKRFVFFKQTAVLTVEQGFGGNYTFTKCGEQMLPARHFQGSRLARLSMLQSRFALI